MYFVLFQVALDCTAMHCTVLQCTFLRSLVLSCIVSYGPAASPIIKPHICSSDLIQSASLFLHTKEPRRPHACCKFSSKEALRNEVTELDPMEALAWRHFQSHQLISTLVKAIAYKAFDQEPACIYTYNHVAHKWARTHAHIHTHKHTQTA